MSIVYPGDVRLTAGVYGLTDETGSAEGALLPLEGMMALDSLKAALEGREDVYHLSGRNMRHYARDEVVMTRVEAAIGGTLERLGHAAINARQIVIDVTGLPAAIHPDAAQIVSQYDLIAAGEGGRGIPLVEASFHLPAHTSLE